MLCIWHQTFCTRFVRCSVQDFLGDAPQPSLSSGRSLSRRSSLQPRSRSGSVSGTSTSQADLTSALGSETSSYNPAVGANTDLEKAIKLSLMEATQNPSGADYAADSGTVIDSANSSAGSSSSSGGASKNALEGAVAGAVATPAGFTSGPITTGRTNTDACSNETTKEYRKLRGFCLNEVGSNVYDSHISSFH